MQSEAHVAPSRAVSRDHAAQDPRQVELPRSERAESAVVHMLVIKRVSSCSKSRLEMINAETWRCTVARSAKGRS